MPLYTTQLFARNVTTGEMEVFQGMPVEAPSWELAHEFCVNNGFGYLQITGKLEMEIENEVVSEFNVQEN